jgi:1A family penicillin-binding protein
VATAQQASDNVVIVKPPMATVVLDRDGGLLAEIGPQARSWARIVDLPAYLGQAFVATEDRRFYQHDGVDVVGVMGAIRDNLLHGFGSRGASTITQQLVGAMGLVDRTQRTGTAGLSRKVREAEFARALERRHNKAEILEAYINYINFGHGWYGVESASRHYFGKSATELSLAEAATLAALPKSPVAYDPREHPAAAMRRRNTVLALMSDQGYITDVQRRAALTTPLRVAPNDGYSVRAPYVVEWVRQWLADRYSLNAVNTAGMIVTTTVDPYLQDAAGVALVQGLARVESLPGYRHPRYATGGAVHRGARTPYLQGLIVSLDPATGDVLALVGGRDFRDSEFNRAVQGLRQAGSAFKPFVYASALAQGLPPTELLVDSAISLPKGDGTRWTPENSDGTWSGPVTMRTALMRSINIPAVRLALQVGMDSVIGTARRLGMTTPIPPFAPTAIGAADVRPLELIGAYTGYATLGAWTPPRIVTLVQDANGTPIYEAPVLTPAAALDPRVAYQLTSMLQDAVQRGTGTAARRGLPDSLPIAGKSGTTNDNADVWFVGYTPNLVAGVWMGFDQRQTITHGAFGGTLAAPIWNLYAKRAYERRAIPQAWPIPPGLVAARVRRRDGMLAPNDTTDATVTEYFLEGTEPTARAMAQRVLQRLQPLLARLP